jgi:hypothetical protein
MQGAVYLLCFMIIGFLSVLPVWADHDVPYYPSFYPQEIHLAPVDPAAAALLLHDKQMHAYIGATPHFAATVPDHLAFMESLRSYRVITFNPASAALQEREDRCAVARHALADFAREPQNFVFHPYPIPPYGRSSTARVTYHILASAFYDGTQIDMADLLYPYVVAYRWGVKGDTEQRLYDPAVATATALMRERLVGVRLVRVDQTVQKFGDTEVLRESPAVDVYLNHTAMDDRQVAALAPPWSSVPWHVLVLMEEAVQQNLAAFSESEALRRGVPWLDLVRDARLHKQLQALVEVFAQQGYRPEALQDMVTPEIARQRWARLKESAHTQGHFLVTNGPYRLHTWSPESVVLQIVPYDVTP